MSPGDAATVTLTLKDVYFSELFLQATVVVDSCERLFAIAPGETEERQYVISKETYSLVSSILYAAANIKKSY